MYRFLVLTFVLFSTLYSQQLTPLGDHLANNYNLFSDSEEIKIWIFFSDKGPVLKQNFNADMLLTEKAINRRLKVLQTENIFSERDLPVYKNYIDIISERVNKIRHTSKWFNGVSAVATKTQIESMRQLAFIKEIELVASYGKSKPERTEEVIEEAVPEYLVDSLNYGTSRKQVDQINVIPLHNRGIRGQGVLVAVFDNGFRLLTHESFSTMNIVAGYDFVDNEPNPAPPVGSPSSWGAHGINTLSTVGGYKAGQLVGPAYKADFLVARTENDASETPVEEDNWARAVEWADSLGADIISSSLGYLTYSSPYTSWTWQNMNGNTTLVTKAANRADSLGIVVVNSAGNEASKGTPNTLIAPADGFYVITAGAVDSFGVRTSFSSYGPTFDGRIKPNVMAMGRAVKAASASSTTGYSRVDGTSFSCPLSAGVAALILSAHPSLTPAQVREAMQATASRSNNPDNYYGWGILNATAAVDYFKTVINHNPISGIQFNTPQTIIFSVNSVQSIRLDSSFVVYGKSGKFIYSSPIQSTGNPNEYSAIIPAMGTGSFVTYYIKILNAGGLITSLPTNAPTEYYSYTIGGTTSTLNGAEGWNLISIPVTLSNYQLTNVFPSASSSAYEFQNGYVEKDTLENGKGYWIKFIDAESIELTGYVRNIDTLEVTLGWNLIGSITNQISKSNIIQEPSNIINSNFYYYKEKQYSVTDTLKPTFGYWVKVSQSGKLILNSSNKK